MALNKNFLRPYLNLPRLSRSRLMAGIALGLFLAFSLYSFLYLSREAIRVLFFRTIDQDLLVLTDAQVYAYNLFFAYIATIFGQSLCLVYWLDNAIGKYGKQRFKVRAVINDQRYFNGYFLFWFSKVGYSMSVVFGGLSLFIAFSKEDVYP